jgi:hypothetical protein
VPRRPRLVLPQLPVPMPEDIDAGAMTVAQ